MIVCVPDLSATELTAALNRERRLNYLDPNQASWDFYTDRDGNPIPGRGKKFEVIVWKPKFQPDEIIPSESVREHFRALGAHGNVGAFTEWLRQAEEPSDYYATIPEDSACSRLPDDNLCAPYSSFAADCRMLNQHRLDIGWGHYWVFVGFREVP